MNCLQWEDESILRHHKLLTNVLCFKQAFHMDFKNRIINHHIIDFRCELTITEFDMANVTLSYVISTHLHFTTGNRYILENNDHHVTGCI